MKAMLFNEHGGTEVLRYEEVDEPKIGHQDVLFNGACNRNEPQ